MQTRAVPVVLTVLVLLWGSYLRLSRLGSGSLGVDELNHHFAGASLARGNAPLLPSGKPYTRGLAYSWLVGETQEHVSDPELADRLPSALLGIVGLALIASIGWALGGPWTAFWAALLLAIYPQALFQARNSRFYTYQLVFGLIALYTGWRTLRDAGSLARPTGDAVRRQWLWAGATLVAFLLAAQAQVTTLTVLLGWSVATAVAAVADVRARGWRAWHRSVPLQLTAVGLFLAAAAPLVAPDALRTGVRLARSAPLWTENQAGGPLAYFAMLKEPFPLLMALVPVIFLAAALKCGRVALYLFLWFAVPVLVHSVALAWKGERFILLALPALFLATALAIVVASDALYRGLQKGLEGSALGPKRSRTLAGIALAVAAAYAVWATPAFYLARHVPGGETGPVYLRDDWRKAGAVVRAAGGGDSVPVGVSVPLAPLAYGMPLDFVVRRGALEQSLGGGLLPQGSPDLYTAAPVLTTPEAIRGKYPAASTVLVVIDSSRWRTVNIEESLRSALTNSAEELCQGACGRLMVFRWPLQPGGQPARPGS